MNISEIIQASYDFWRPNRYGLKSYLIKDGKKHPVAIICPGGAYGMVCSFVEGKPIAKALNARGYHAFVVYYRTKKKALYPHPQEDLKHAIQDIFSHEKEWNLDLNGWSLWGSSAGGHLAASYCIEKWDAPKPTALILAYPVVSMGKYTHTGTRDNLLGKNCSQDMIDKLSIEKHVTSDFPPSFIWYGTSDKVVDPINTKLLSTAMDNFSLPHQVETYEGINHGVGLAKHTIAENWIDHAIVFWNNNK